MSDPTPGPIEYMLRDIREALQMDVAFVSEFAGDQLVFRALEGDAGSFGWREGEGMYNEGEGGQMTAQTKEESGRTT